MHLFQRKRRLGFFFFRMTFSDIPAINLNPCWGEIWYSRSPHPSLSLFQIAQNFKHFLSFLLRRLTAPTGRSDTGGGAKETWYLNIFKRIVWILNGNSLVFSFPLGVRRPRPQPRLRGQHGDGGEGGGGACGGKAGSVGGERSGLRRKV